MLPIKWNEDKNTLLKKTRNVSFEDVMEVIANNEIIDITEHPNQERYPNQKVFVLNIRGYIHYVPFVEDEEKIFLKTIIPSRKYNASYK